MSSRLLIVEDHAVLTQTLALALRSEGYEVEFAEDLSPDAVLEQSRRSAPDVVLLDLELGEERTALPLVKPLRDLGAEVVLVTGSRDRRLVAEALEAGACGLFRKSDPLDRLLEMIDKAASHAGTASSVAEREQLLYDMRRERAEERDMRAPFERLTPNEREVLRALMAGKVAEAIAAERTVSLPTIRTQVRSILQKLNCHSQLEAVALARQVGWPWG